MIVKLDNIYLRYSDRTILDNIKLQIEDNDKIGLIGPNGMGKSSLLKVIAGLVETEDGSVTKVDNKKITYLSQDITGDQEVTVYEFITRDINKEDIKEHEFRGILNKFGIFDHERIVSTLSGGEKKRVMLASTLVKPCDLLLLDEPTNHLDIEMISYLEKFLVKFNRAIVLVTHDRYFLERVVNKIIEIDDGKLYHYGSNYNEYLENKLLREEIKEANERKKAVFLRKEIEWAKRGARARETKNKLRMENVEKLKQEVKKVETNLEIVYNTSRLGRKIIEINNISKDLNGKKLVKNFSYLVDDDDRIGIIGSNGRGKTTLLNILTKNIEVDSGKVEVGETVRFGYYRQEDEIKENTLRVYDYLTRTQSLFEVNNIQITPAKLLDKFLFDKTLQFSPISKLSGGERKRFILLNVLVKNPNVLLLDEPTNDFDIDTLMVLEDFINNFSGPVIVVSHDRYFLDHICNKLFVMENDGSISIYNGNYTDNIDKINYESNLVVKKTDTRVKQKSDKLTYNEKKELEQIEDVITSIESEISELTEEINNNYANYALVEGKIKKKEELENLLEDKISRWEYLILKDESSR